MKTKFLIAFISLVSAFVYMQPENPTKVNFSRGIWVVQFNASFNKNNEYKWNELPGINYHLIDLDKDEKMRRKMRITSVPTIVVFKNGRELKRWEGGMQFKISVRQQEILNYAKK